MPSYRFILLITCLLLGACAGYSAGVLSSATWAEARALDLIFPFYSWHIQPFTAADLTSARHGLALAALGLTATGTSLLLPARGRHECTLLGQETRRAWAGLGQGLARLTTRQRHQALGLLAALTALRLYFSLYNPEYDDAVSYEVFVSKGWLATSAYYPIPNNHVLSNTISLLFYQLSPNFWWTMRLPVLLICTAATIILFVGLLRRAGFGVAAGAVTLFSCLQLSLYHAGVGRGYWLVILLAGVVFFSTLTLSRARGRHRAAGLALALAGVLGCYTVPPFVYVLASAFSWLGLVYGWRRRWRQLGQLGALGALIGLTTVALYTPLLLVSGGGSLVGNGYVTALALGTFWRGLPGYVWHNEGFLAGQRTLGALITLPVLALTGWLLYLARTGQLPAPQARRWRRLGWPALWFVSLPYALILVQRVYPPERVLLYKAFFFFILAALVGDWLLTQWPAPGHRWPRRALAIAAILFVAYETYSVVRVNPAARGTNAAYHAGLRWLVTQPPGPVLIPEPTHNLFFRFYAHSEQRQRPWRIDNDQQAQTRYAYVVAFPNKRGFFQPQFLFAPAYQNAEVEIYVVPKGYLLITKTWRH